MLSPIDDTGRIYTCTIGVLECDKFYEYATFSTYL
nr:MAG TPA: hypothetical protein [Caudoviricetes sp.]